MFVTSFTLVRKTGDDYTPDLRGTHVKATIDQGGPEYPHRCTYIMDLETDETIALRTTIIKTQYLQVDTAHLVPGSFRDLITTTIKNFIRENQCQ